MNSGKWVHVWLVLIVLIIGAGVAWIWVNHSQSQRVSSSVDAADWVATHTESLGWTSEKIGGRIPSLRWSVQYEYLVDGIRYRGSHIVPGRDVLHVGYGEYPIDMMGRFREIRSVWYDPAAPARSALFRTTADRIDSDLRATYIELTIRAKSEGRWP